MRAASGWTAFIESLPESLRTWWRTYVRLLSSPSPFRRILILNPHATQLAPTIGGLSTDALGEGYAHRAWHLHLFGVLPAFHGQGYGRLLVQHVDRLVRLAVACIYVAPDTLG